jgi:hypothetical protein
MVICAENANQYQIAVSDLSLETTHSFPAEILISMSSITPSLLPSPSYFSGRIAPK